MSHTPAQRQRRCTARRPACSTRHGMLPQWLRVMATERVCSGSSGSRWPTTTYSTPPTARSMPSLRRCKSRCQPVCRGACALDQVAHVLAHAGERSGGVHGSGACASLLHCSVRASGLGLGPWPKLVLRRGACKRLSSAGRCIPAALGTRLALTPSHKQVCVRALETRVTIGALISLIDAFAPFPAGPVAEAVPPLPVR